MQCGASNSYVCWFITPSFTMAGYNYHKQSWNCSCKPTERYLTGAPHCGYRRGRWTESTKKAKQPSQGNQTWVQSFHPPRKNVSIEGQPFQNWTAMVLDPTPYRELGYQWVLSATTPCWAAGKSIPLQTCLILHLGGLQKCSWDRSWALTTGANGC